MEESLLGLALDLGQELLEGLRRDLGEVALELVAEALEDLAQVDQPVRVGPVVDAVDRRLLGEEELLRHGLVGRQHELLDQPVGDVARLGDDADDEPGVVEDDVGVREVEVDRAPRLAPPAQEGRDLAHEAEVGEDRRRTAARPRVRRPSRGAARPPCTSCGGRSGSRPW